uniref:DNA-directed RNA polymerase III subunit RPC9 n=1 Tax=Octactis speculum TaxID=3111310 RepID=A0A7S2B0W5_9STRA|mmetsp:Transcript_18109/g.24444  ORF Transcript_18109/g.24444 Transcript_18109/m.24444 type:complete len:154 (+) Transcript_18109:14-475(+)
MEDDGGNVNELKFGADFDSSMMENQSLVFLTNQEVAVILDRIKTDREKNNRNPPTMMLDTLDYVKRNCGVNSINKVEKFTESLRNRLKDMEDESQGEPRALHPFEIAALANLMQADSEQIEAMEVIPSLRRFDTAFVDQILDVCKQEMEELMI